MAEQTFYYELPDGALREVVTTETDPAPPDGATVLTADEYNAKKTAREADLTQQQADTQAAERAQKKNAYDALNAANFDPAVASTLSGYTPSTSGVA
ncbi:hypothetical protein ACFY2T_41380 [Streptomyces sp. NPDC001260]|uniref:hypothetical protein n=1 Tax=Streptomyces sp. NPDC001260 TaxID=3364551 RepID=UPI00368A0C82